MEKREEKWIKIVVLISNIRFSKSLALVPVKKQSIKQRQDKTNKDANKKAHSQANRLSEKPKNTHTKKEHRRRDTQISRARR